MLLCYVGLMGPSRSRVRSVHFVFFCVVVELDQPGCCTDDTTYNYRMYVGRYLDGDDDFAAQFQQLA